MGKLLFIDSDDINGLSEALQEALERRGINFGEFNYTEDDDIDPYIGIMPKRHYGGCGFAGCGASVKHTDDDNWLFQESGGRRYNSGNCGVSTQHYGGCGSGGCGYTHSYGGCGSGGC